MAPIHLSHQPNRGDWICSWPSVRRVVQSQLATTPLQAVALTCTALIVVALGDGVVFAGVALLLQHMGSLVSSAAFVPTTARGVFLASAASTVLRLVVWLLGVLGCWVALSMACAEDDASSSSHRAVDPSHCNLQMAVLDSVTGALCALFFLDGLASGLTVHIDAANGGLDNVARRLHGNIGVAFIVEGAKEKCRHAWDGALLASHAVLAIVAFGMKEAQTHVTAPSFGDGHFPELIESRFAVVTTAAGVSALSCVVSLAVLLRARQAYAREQSGLILAQGDDDDRRGYAVESDNVLTSLRSSPLGVQQSSSMLALPAGQHGGGAAAATSLYPASSASYVPPPRLSTARWFGPDGAMPPGTPERSIMRRERSLLGDESTEAHLTAGLLAASRHRAGSRVDEITLRSGAIAFNPQPHTTADPAGGLVSLADGSSTLNDDVTIVKRSFTTEDPSSGTLKRQRSDSHYNDTVHHSRGATATSPKPESWMQRVWRGVKQLAAVPFAAGVMLLSAVEMGVDTAFTGVFLPLCCLCFPFLGAPSLADALVWNACLQGGGRIISEIGLRIGAHAQAKAWSAIESNADQPPAMPRAQYIGRFLVVGLAFFAASGTCVAGLCYSEDTIDRWVARAIFCGSVAVYQLLRGITKAATVMMQLEAAAAVQHSEEAFTAVVVAVHAAAGFFSLAAAAFLRDGVGFRELTPSGALLVGADRRYFHHSIWEAFGTLVGLCACDVAAGVILAALRPAADDQHQPMDVSLFADQFETSRKASDLSDCGVTTSAATAGLTDTPTTAMASSSVHGGSLSMDRFSFVHRQAMQHSSPVQALFPSQPPHLVTPSPRGGPRGGNQSLRSPRPPDADEYLAHAYVTPARNEEAWTPRRIDAAFEDA